MIAYGSTGGVTHAARVSARNSSGIPTRVISKWGQMELIESWAISPFTSVYGPAIGFFQ